MVDTDRIEFKTEKGGVVFGVTSPYFLQSADGTAGGNLYKTQVNYIDADGTETLGVLYEPRSITIKGYIRANNRKEMYQRRQTMLKILNGKDKGMLIYTCDTGKYQTEAELESLVEWGTPIQNFYPFVVYFSAYKFYWKSADCRETPIFTREKKLKNTFSLPKAFSTRTSKANICNHGDVDTPCIFEIVCTAAGSEAGTEKGIEIINRTTGKHLVIDRDMQAGEKILIDTEHVSVMSSVAGNILNRVRFDSDTVYKTDLSMRLKIGENMIECIHYNSQQAIAVNLKHYDLYSGV